MRYKDFLENRMREAIPRDEILPSGYHLVGYVALLNIKKGLMKYSREIGQATLEYDKRIQSVAVRVGPTTGLVRNPSYELVAGRKDTLVTHVENQAKYRLDPLVLTFSGGNKKERIRMKSITEPGEIVFDMFACVGQFAIPIAMNNAGRVYAAEINPVAYDFLLENISLNAVENKIIPYLGDCQELHPDEKVDRVVMGYLHDTHRYFGHAVGSLKKRGGVIHMHVAVERDATQEIAKYIERIGCDYDFRTSISKRVIKNYAPNVKHYVFDVELTSNS